VGENKLNVNKNSLQITQRPVAWFSLKCRFCVFLKAKKGLAYKLEKALELALSLSAGPFLDSLLNGLDPSRDTPGGVFRRLG